MFKISRTLGLFVLATSFSMAQNDNTSVQEIVAAKYAEGKSDEAKAFLDQMEKDYVLAALYMKGVLYINGCYNNGIRNPREASIYFAKAAALNYPPALAALADSFLDGDGTQKDEKEAFRLYKQAADLGNGAGQFNVAILYRDGTGTKKSILKALHYLDLASENESLGALREDARKLHDAILPEWKPK